MQPAWKILAPIDLSIKPDGPIEHAINIALAMGAELTLLYVVDQRGNSRRARLSWPLNDFEGRIDRLRCPSPDSSRRQSG
jgi:nucleotide-binding universal stress UspA family protein